MSYALVVDRLSKAYRIGVRQSQADTLTGLVQNLLLAPWRNWRRLAQLDTSSGRDEAPDLFWALRDVSFTVPEGEVVGVIGRNGAGKSTLLKILSRITDPTAGRAEIRGRVSSLLEVGTGFHPELSGRDNVYMNGTILGMTKREIDRKFEEIVEFSGVERFLDTPIKRYSSGMKVRLAFAVAAHLEPEILIIDEVLAVGDAEFQKKCLGKMHDVAQDGRTVLFVSHSMNAVANLCTSAVIMEHGRCSPMMAADEAIVQYLGQGSRADADGLLAGVRRFQDEPRPPFFHALSLETPSGAGQVASVGDPVRFEIQLQGLDRLLRPECAVVITDHAGQRVVLFHTRYHSGLELPRRSTVTLECRIESLPLIPGAYFVDLVLADGKHVVERVEQALRFEMVFADVFGTGAIPMTGQGQVVLECQWEAVQQPAPTKAGIS